MAENSKREQIILQVIVELETMSSIKTVVRKLQEHSDLETFALTQFPVIAVVGRLPVPDEHISGRRPARADIMVSKLIVDLYVYFQERESPDSMISNLADDLWVKLNEDQTKNGLVISTILRMTEDPEYWDPFVAFKFSCEFKYVHTTGGI